MSENKKKHSKNIKRVGKGHFAPGFVANPTGENGLRRSGLAPWKIRVEQLLNKYGTVGHIKQLVADGSLDLEHPIDGMILKNIIDSFTGEDSRMQREAFLDRLEGKPRENKVVRVIKSVGDLTDEELEALAQDGS